MANDRATSPISVPSSHQRRASLASFSFGSPPAANAANAANASTAPQQRRLSITTLGLAGSPTQTSPFNGRHFRGGSVSSSVGSNPTSSEDSINEENDLPSVTPTSPFARRVSYGAHALRDVRRGSVNNDERFNWSEALRTRAERAPSLSAMQQNQNAASVNRQREQERAVQIATMEQPMREIPRQPKPNKPDFFQEKILRGDFMD
jgi:hypothetical protein